ncbi:MAG TPA: winged helix-turn-helix domain-containing protein, partial [Pseudoxanthomonas sp.]|nr:winged helix-turn-helix domain-containing protein [Pseudoxanthomonas sp.]
MPQPDPSRLAFDDVVIDFVGRRLMRAGGEQPLEPKAFAVLALLAGSPGRVFTRDELLDAVWGHRHVTQSVLNRIMSLLRQALDEDAQHPRLLHTVYGIGYRFDLPAAAGIAAVSAEPEGAPRWRRSRVIVSACVLLLTLGGVIWVQRNVSLEAPGEPIATQARPSLAVLPFADLSQARDQGYLADGLAEEIRNQLAQSPALRVVGRTSSDAFKGTDDLRAIG